MRTSQTQYEMMVEFMEANGDLSKPSGGPRGRNFIQMKWKELTNKLNSEGTGESRSEEKWRKVWSDYKNNCKKKCAKINRAVSGTGGGPALQLTLTDLENRVMQIIGVQAATGMVVEEAGFQQEAAEISQPSEMRVPDAHVDDYEIGDTGATKKHRKRAVKEETDDEALSRLMYREKHLPEMKKQWHNLTTLLKYSNVTPFKERNDAGYVCAYCFKTYPDPDDLRAHTHKDHAKEKPSYKAGTGMSSFVALLDIVDLKCMLCEQPMETLQILTEHLVSVHDKKYYLGVTDYFQPFKLSNEQQMNCCLCNEVFHTMKLLMQHMNMHYRNFICTTCGAGFVNSFRLNRHETTHSKKKSSYPCRHCGQVFAAESKKKAHVNTEHKGIAGDSVCQICKARFKNYYQKTRHMIQVHNAEGVKCDQCEKKFNLKSNLMLHMRSVHLKERPYECSVCSMGFFIKRHMLGHYMATHTNERKFKCEVCGKAYATQNSKRKHLKKNHGISLTKNNMMVPNMAK